MQIEAFSLWINTFLFPDGFPASENVNQVPTGTDGIRIPFRSDSALYSFNNEFDAIRGIFLRLKVI